MTQSPFVPGALPRQRAHRTRPRHIRSAAPSRMVASAVAAAIVIAVVPRPSLRMVEAGAAPLAVLNDVLVLAASAVAWLAAVWCLLLVAIGVLAAAPGVCGVLGRVLLRRVAPVTVRRFVGIGVGISLMTAAAACGPQPDTAPVTVGPVDTPRIAAAAATMTAPSDTTPPDTAAPETAPPTSPPSIDIDWPTDNPGEPAGPAAQPESPAEPSETLGESAAPAARAVTPDAPAAPDGAPAAAPKQNDRAAPPHPATTEKPSDDATVVTVRRGDTLWSIAADHLPDSASDADIDGAWRAWFATNRAVIGSNPNVIIPGQRLVCPPSERNAS